MGVWGPGHLENDTALDERAERSEALASTIWARLQAQESWEADEWAHAALFLDLEALLALDATGLFDRAALARFEDLGGALARWRAGWEAYLPELDPSAGFTARRWAVIEGTFARLEALVRQARSS